MAYRDGDEIMACEVCRRVLDFDGLRGKHIHTLAYLNPDHEPVAVPASSMVASLNLVCDFCGNHVEVKDVWTLPATTFVMPQIPGDAIRNSIGDWLCCKTCAELINGGRWPELVERVLVTHRLPVGARAHMRRLYREVERHAIGAAERRLSYAVREE